MGWQLRSYMTLRALAHPLAQLVLRKRHAKGRETPERAAQKQGRANVARPEGMLIWLHAVGLGEVMALRPLIAALQEQAPQVQILLTSSARSAGIAVGAQMPAGVIHQALPLDVPRYTRAFLDHWRPDLAIWSEQDLWPGLIEETAARNIPLAYVNARMTDESVNRRRKLAGLYRDTLRHFTLIAAQEARTAHHLTSLGARNVQIMGSLKPAAAPLGYVAQDLDALRATIGARPVWLAASTHADDEAMVLAAHRELLGQDPTRLLILAPRAPERAHAIMAECAALGLTSIQRSTAAPIMAGTEVYIADTLGEMGLWIRLAQIALIGGSFGPVGGHNPWEAICLGCPVLHGPNLWNFRADYDQLAASGLAQQIAPGDVIGLARAIAAPVPRADAQALIVAARREVTKLAQRLLALSRAKT